MQACLATKKQSNPLENDVRNNWSLEEVRELFALPFNDLLFKAHTLYRKYFNPNEIQASTILNVKTGSCPENCSYCGQSAHFNTGLKKEPLWEVDAVLEKARLAKETGASRFCIGAAWRGPTDKDLDKVVEMVKGVKEIGLEACVTLGLLKGNQAQKLKDAGLDFYNHNIDTSPGFYSKIITTRNFDDRMETIGHVREAGLKVCCGGIIGLGEAEDDRANMLLVLANMPVHPESIPINRLVPIEGTPLEHDQDSLHPIDFVKTIAVARIMMPKSRVRLTGGRHMFSDEMQALCFFAGANSIHYGEKLLVTPNSTPEKDNALLARLGIVAM